MKKFLNIKYLNPVANKIAEDMRFIFQATVENEAFIAKEVEYLISIDNEKFIFLNSGKESSGIFKTIWDRESCVSVSKKIKVDLKSSYNFKRFKAIDFGSKINLETYSLESLDSKDTKGHKSAYLKEEEINGITCLIAVIPLSNKLRKRLCNNYIIDFGRLITRSLELEEDRVVKTTFHSVYSISSCYGVFPRHKKEEQRETHE